MGWKGWLGDEIASTTHVVILSIAIVMTEEFGVYRKKDLAILA